MSISKYRPRPKKFKPPRCHKKTIIIAEGQNELTVELPGCSIVILAGLQDAEWQDRVEIRIEPMGERLDSTRPWFAQWDVKGYYGGVCHVVREHPGSQFSQRRKQSLIVGVMTKNVS